MTGTVCEICELDENKINTNNYDLFSAWLFGKINAECTINDISDTGCSLLVPINQSVPSNKIKLIIMSPDNANTVHSIICAEAMLVDEGFTTDSKRVEFKFVDVDSELEYEIKLLSMYFESPTGTDIKCSILNNNK